jgi:hypothetical protein
VWEWIVDPSVEPDAGARAALEAATRPDGLPEPVILAAKVVDADGELHPASMPWPGVFAKERMTAAAAQKLVSLRAVRPGALLVRTDLVGRPDGDVLHWSARILRDEDHAGYLVPTALATRTDDALGTLSPRLLLGDAWDLQEKLWLSLLVMQDAARSRRRAGP